MASTQSVRISARGVTGLVASQLQGLSSERANQLTHGVAFVLSVLGAVNLGFILNSRAEFFHWVGLGTFALTMTVLFLASTLSHSFGEGCWRHRFRTLDQLCIFVFISGGFTPFALLFLAQDWWWLLAASWLAALLGCLAKIYIARLKTLSVFAYLLVGWIPGIAWQPLVAQIPMNAQWLIVASATLYTVGTIFLVNDHRGRFWHATWHIFVTGGTVCIYFALLTCYAHSIAA